MSRTKPELGRRAFLKGVGVTVSLPWMESVKLKAAQTAAEAAKANQPPLRFAALFSGNGFHSKEWWAKGEGAQMQLGKVLAPLEPHKTKLTLVRGLYNAEAMKGNIHSSQTGNILSGAPLASGGAIKSGTSIDQLLAQKIGRQTKVPSLVLGCEPSMASVHKNYSMLYSSHISWSSPTTPTPLEIYPALAFDRLFKENSSATDASVLDAVLGEAKSLRGKISHNDQLKLDEYLNSVREVEQRIEGVPQDIAEHMRLMCDILVLGFQTDTTRFTTLKLNNDHSSLRFSNLGIDYMIHHLLSHTDGADWLRVNQFFVEQVAYIAKRLDAIQEGEKTALDNTIMMYCSSMLTGNHEANQLPVILVGGSAHMKTGRALDYLGKENRKMCSLYLSLMEKYGVKQSQFGDSTEKLAEI